MIVNKSLFEISESEFEAVYNASLLANLQDNQLGREEKQAQAKISEQQEPPIAEEIQQESQLDPPIAEVVQEPQPEPPRNNNIAKGEAFYVQKYSNEGDAEDSKKAEVETDTPRPASSQATLLSPPKAPQVEANDTAKVLAELREAAKPDEEPNVEEMPMAAVAGPQMENPEDNFQHEELSQCLPSARNDFAYEDAEESEEDELASIFNDENEWDFDSDASHDDSNDDE